MTARRSRGEIVAIDLFCGAGGLTLGLARAGIRVVRGIDVDGTAGETYEHNNPASSFMRGDVRSVDSRDLLDGVDRGGSELLLAGCAPCQPFSRHVRGARRDDRRSLMVRFADLVADTLPDHVLAENVPQFMGCRYHGRMLRTLRDCGYSYDEGVVDAADYGVPQHRRRYILLASRRQQVRIPARTHGAGRARYRTVHDAIASYPPVTQGESYAAIPNHCASGLSERNRERMRRTPVDGGSRKDVAGMTLQCHDGHDGHSDVYGRMRWDRPAPTLTCRCNSISNGRFAHPEQDRGMTVREAAAIQTFPDDYVFCSPSMRDNAAHVGNAVPVLLAETLGRAFAGAAARARPARRA